MSLQDLQQAGGDIYIVNADGTGLTGLRTTADDERCYFSDSTGSSVAPNNRVIFERWTGSQYDLYSINADGTGLATLANSADSEWYSGVTSNNRVIFWRYAGGTQYDLYSINADGTGLATLANSADNEYFAAVAPNNRVLFGRMLAALNMTFTASMQTEQD